MTATVTKGTWSPLPGSLPTSPEPDRVYVLPTRWPGDDVASGRPSYVDYVRYLPKEARAADLPVEFSLPPGSRNYLQEFSADAETWALALAAATLVNDWIIFTVGIFIEMRAKAQGWTSSEAQGLPLKVSIVKIENSSESSETWEFEGSGEDVLEALRIRNQSQRDAGELGSGE
ncbi:hypothetical protein C8K30_11715 [Promicromonospora sp. AC04]|uniref:hypothetical protein n=1 Tax=Promicromonospora sp. AC04 TaxID=2135723 RepID=UPI000D476FE2|nr:hypothetical protein [Promicromonospora sp. AC04]PUB20190.1 hypothetical protein C8K30_11715 [Promicromonospora sp. AC04]